MPLASDITNRFIICSEQLALRCVPPGSYSVISINNTYPTAEDTVANLTPIPEGYRSLLQLVFDDLEPGDPALEIQGWLKLFNERQAYQILQFWREYRRQVDHFLIHCTAGISRSAGVGVALATLEGDQQAEAQCRLGTHPNFFVASNILHLAYLEGFGPYEGVL